MLAPATHQLSRRNQEYFLKNAYNLELETKVLEIFTITKKAPTKAYSWVREATTVFTFKTLY